MNDGIIERQEGDSASPRRGLECLLELIGISHLQWLKLDPQPTGRDLGLLKKTPPNGVGGSASSR